MIPEQTPHSKIPIKPEAVMAKYNEFVDKSNRLERQDKSGRMIDDARFLIRQVIKGSSRHEQVERARDKVALWNRSGEIYAENHLPELKRQAEVEARAEGKEVHPL